MDNIIVEILEFYEIQKELCFIGKNLAHVLIIKNNLKTAKKPLPIIFLAKCTIFNWCFCWMF
jgi:hypothetical protein